MGTNMVMIMPNFQRRGGVSLGASSSMALKYSDVTALRNESVSLAAVSPEVRASGHGIYASAVSEEKSAAAITEIEEILRRTHKLLDSEENDFRVMSQSELIATVSSITDILTYLLGAIAGISLLVGGIGIMNIMFVSVTERTREIGLRMSIGGRGKDILRQFLVESMLLSILGGAIGILFGYLIAKGAGTLMSSPTFITTQSVILAFAVCFIIGVFFGWYPARKASNLNPIDALRYE